MNRQLPGPALFYSSATGRFRGICLRGLLVVLSLCTGTSARAQKEFHNWYFGRNAGITFTSNPPRALLNGQMTTLEGSSCISDSAGSLLFYSDGMTVWDRTHTQMPNGYDIGSHYSASQGAVPVRQPGTHHQYYIFTMDSYEHFLTDGLRYAVVDMTRRGRKGDVVTKAPSVLPGVRMTEKLTVTPHANGRDVWVLCHQWESRRFYAFLFTASGLTPTPVISDVGSVHAGPWGVQPLGNAGGYMKASPDGRRVAAAILGMHTEVFDFDPATGRFSNPIALPHLSYNYGVEFSADNSRLYVSNGRDGHVYQYNLLAGSPTAVAASGYQVTPASSTGIQGGMQRGPDGRIYIAMETAGGSMNGFTPGLYVSVIERPNSLGAACGYLRNGLYLGGGNHASLQGMPFALASPPLTVSVPPVVICEGQTATLTVRTSQPVPANTVRWKFGDRASGAADSARGLTVTHTYLHRGTYTVSVQVQAGDIYTATTTVLVVPQPIIDLGPDRDLCLGTSIRLSAGRLEPGLSYRWQDGSTDSTLLVHAAGSYSVVVARGSCTAHDTVAVRALPGTLHVPNVITPDGDGLNDTFVVTTGCSSSEWALELYNRWGRQVYASARYGNDWSAPGLGPGSYFYLLRASGSSQLVKGWVEVVR